MTLALVGNPNCGKTTLFNALTGANQHVGNFPGVTVDRKDGQIRGHANTLVTDLPGIYSMSPYTNEEIVTRQFILRETVASSDTNEPVHWTKQLMSGSYFQFTLSNDESKLGLQLAGK